ncbi:MAG TPA: hypothetical protein VMW27_29625 [Thermoanaerobaculia bacterium]|nr:hypothetical protein [Thermoanaerobaculia bacterium]
MRTQRLFPALLCGAALFAFACGGADREAERVDAKTETQAQAEKPEAWQIVDEPAEDQKTAEETVEQTPETNELRPEPREVRVDAQALEQPARDHRETELAEREQRLAERQAEIAARERELREREARATTRPAPEPEPVETKEVTGSEARVEPQPAPEPVEPEPVQPSRTVTATVPAGTLLEAELLERLSSNGSTAGETFRARLVEDVLDEGEVVIPAGSEVVGVIDEAVPLRRVGGRAKLSVRFTDLVLPSGATVPIRASLIQQGRSETGKDAATIGGVAAGGAILGRILNKGDRSKGAVIGAIIGAVAGTAIASRTPGEEVVLPEGTVINLGLDQDVEVRSRR